MQLIVFDLDGTLLNGKGKLSPYTKETLARLADRDIAYTVATGRTLHAARHLLDGYGFGLPHVYKNGVMIWDPANDEVSHQHYLDPQEVAHVLAAVTAQHITPFVFTWGPEQRHVIYHADLRNDTEQRLARQFLKRREVEVRPASELPASAQITNISALGAVPAVRTVEALIEQEPQLVAYAGPAWEGDDWRWIDIHHTDASKGTAVDTLRAQLGAERVICFGDSDNDLSMFARADESYAPENADEHIKAAATAVIGHHDQDGVARFLRERFELDR